MGNFLKVLIGIVVGFGLITGGLAYLAIFSNNTVETDEGHILFIDKKEPINIFSEKLVDQDHIVRSNSFNIVAKLMKYDSTTMKTGKYIIPAGSNNHEIISILRSGNQTPVSITFNNVRNIQELSGKITSNLLLDSLTFLNTIQEQHVLDSFQFNKQDILTLFIPNTYEVFWDISFEMLVARMHKEHKRFWNSERIMKSNKLKLTPKEVYTLASIVEKETIANSEKSRIAGVYYNRLQKNMLLQADPTVVFANGDFTLRRVLNKHLEIDSPYNTYKYQGLPPGPIYMPDINTIDAVLNLEKHKYLYFCAKADDSGLHAFAKTNAQHAANAKKFHNWLNSQKIYQ